MRQEVDSSHPSDGGRLKSSQVNRMIINFKAKLFVNEEDKENFA